MTIKTLLNNISDDLKNSGIENYLFEAKDIISNVLNTDKMYLILNKDKKIDEKKIKTILQMVEKRKKGYPPQYLLGYQEFMSLNFKVNNSVLIPRQDTECLVEHVMSLAKNPKKYSILDIGTGSGCIAISLAYYIKNCKVTAIDISLEALKVAKENAQNNNLKDKIKFLCNDVFKYQPQEQEYDFIVSNPPYIPTDVINGLSSEVKDYEPYNALDGGQNGLDFYPRLIDICCSSLKPEGYLCFETGHDQAENIAGLIKNKNGFENIEIINDLCGIKRVVSAQKKIRD